MEKQIKTVASRLRKIAVSRGYIPDEAYDFIPAYLGGGYTVSRVVEILSDMIVYC